MKTKKTKIKTTILKTNDFTRAQKTLFEIAFTYLIAKCTLDNLLGFDSHFSQESSEYFNMKETEATANLMVALNYLSTEDLEDGDFLYETYYDTNKSTMFIFDHVDNHRIQINHMTCYMLHKD